MSRCVEHLYEQATGRNPKYMDPPPTDLEMTRAIKRARSGELAPTPNPPPRERPEERPIYIILMREMVTVSPLRNDIPTTLVGRRDQSGAWCCTIIQEQMSPEDVDDIAMDVRPEFWRSVDELPGLGTFIKTYFDPEFIPCPGDEIAAKTERLWRRSVANGTTGSDVFPQDDVTL